MVEDLPEAHNRVTLSPDDGRPRHPRPRVSYTVGENSRLALDYGIQRGRRSCSTLRGPTPCATTPWPGRRAGT